MTTQPTPTPMISATKLAERWNCHLSTISRKVKTGALKPVLRSGPQMLFAVSDILRVESGLMPKHRGAKSLTVGQQAALPGILALLGIEGADLTPSDCESLCGIFHSVLHEDRWDLDFLARHIELQMMGARAICRAETIETVGASPVLTAMVRDLYTTVISLIPHSQRGGLPA